MLPRRRKPQLWIFQFPTLATCNQTLATCNLVLVTCARRLKFPEFWFPTSSEPRGAPPTARMPHRALPEGLTLSRVLLELRLQLQDGLCQLLACLSSPLRAGLILQQRLWRPESPFRAREHPLQSLGRLRFQHLRTEFPRHPRQPPLQGKRTHSPSWILAQAQVPAGVALPSRGLAEGVRSVGGVGIAHHRASLTAHRLSPLGLLLLVSVEQLILGTLALLLPGPLGLLLPGFLGQLLHGLLLLSGRMRQLGLLPRALRLLLDQPLLPELPPVGLPAPRRLLAPPLHRCNNPPILRSGPQTAGVSPRASPRRFTPTGLAR